MSRNRSRARGPARTVITARGPFDLVAAVPYLIGFTPAASVVVVSLRGPRLRLGLVARLDLPPVEREREFARSMIDFVRRDNPREVVVLVYDDQPYDRFTRPGHSLVDAIDSELACHGVPVREAIYVTPTRFWSLSCTSDRCCPPAGTAVHEVSAGLVAATFVAQGRSPMAGRQSLIDRLAPLDPTTLEAVSGAVASTLADVRPHWQQSASPQWPAWQRASVAAFDTVARRYVVGGATLSPAEAGRVLAGLVDLTVRDVVATCWTRWWQSLMPTQLVEDDELAHQLQGLVDDSPVPDVEDDAVIHGVEQLLVDLAARCEGVTALAPLTLLGMHAWANGEGAQARVAIEQALAFDPTYGMAGLVEGLLQGGRAPLWVAAGQAEDEAAAPRSSSHGSR